MFVFHYPLFLYCFCLVFASAYSSTSSSSPSCSADISSIENPTTSNMTEYTPEQPFVTRKINLKVLSIEQAEGRGARVRRSIGTAKLRNFDPFLMLDEFKVGPEAGFPDHPHRGFETVTYMLPTTKGSFCHEDFGGHKGVIGPGDLQWMTAGKGIVHSEMPMNDEISHGLQLWVNLAAKDKMVEPAYQELLAKQIPHVSQDGVTAIVIAGQAFGTKSPVYTRTPTYYLHFMMKPGAELRQEIPKGWNSFIYTIDGKCYVGEETPESLCDAHHTVTLTNTDSANGIYIKAPADSSCEFVLLSGKPHNEPIVQHGPFVMNTQTEIQQAFMDYQRGTNGFEKARHWTSEIGQRMMH